MSITQMSGLRFGRLIVLERASNSAAGSARWLCRCDCGGWKTTTGTLLRAGQTRSCGCLQAQAARQNVLSCAGVNALDLTGQRFGRLTAMWRADNSGRHAKWICACDCGASTTTRVSSLRRGYTRSCGCLNRENITGQRFGELMAIKHVAHGTWRCVCTCGGVVDKSVGALRYRSKMGRLSCGCKRGEFIRAALRNSPEQTNAARYKVLARQKEAGHKRVETLAESYVAGVIGLPVAGVPKHLIDMKREQLTLRRLAKQIKQAATEAKEPDETVPEHP